MDALKLCAIVTHVADARTSRTSSREPHAPPAHRRAAGGRRRSARPDPPVGRHRRRGGHHRRHRTSARRPLTPGTTNGRNTAKSGVPQKWSHKNKDKGSRNVLNGSLLVFILHIQAHTTPRMHAPCARTTTPAGMGRKQEGRRPCVFTPKSGSKVAAGIWSEKNFCLSLHHKNRPMLCSSNG